MKADGRKQLFFNFAIAPVVFAVAMFAGAVAGLPVEAVWVFPAVLAAAYPILIYIDAPRFVIWIFGPALALSGMLSVLRYGGESLTPFGALACVSVIVGAYTVLGFCQRFLSLKMPFSSVLVPVFCYAAVGGSMLALNDPYFDYWIKPLKWKVGIAIEHGYDDRLRSSAKRLSRTEDLRWELCLSALDNNPNASQILIELGADPLADDKHGSYTRNAFDCALNSASITVLDYLLNTTGRTESDLPAGAIVGREAHRSWGFDTEDEDRATLLRRVLSTRPADGGNDGEKPTALLRLALDCYSCKTRTIQTLLDFGADPDSAANKAQGNPESIIEYAIRKKGADEPVVVLLQNALDIDE